MTVERAPVEVLKVSATSKPVAVAGAIAGVIRSKGRVEVQAIGAGAINQAVKAIAISRGYVAPGGLDLVCIPAFIDISIDGEERTGIRLLGGRSTPCCRSHRSQPLRARHSGLRPQLHVLHRPARARARAPRPLGGGAS